MKAVRVFVTGLGAISPAGSGMESIHRAISGSESFLTPLDLFEPGTDGALPAGQVRGLDPASLPRTHLLAIDAAKQAMGKNPPPESIFLGCTTGGMALSEELLAAGKKDPELFSMHGTGTVTESIAKSVNCKGPVFTVSTACSSSAVAIGLAVFALRSGQFVRVLAGGADSLCQLTYFGFHMLQLVDAEGARPLDVNRAGMSVSEGAAMLLLQAADSPPAGAMGEILGVGLSCDAYHPTAPDPHGAGARKAMEQALHDAQLPPSSIHYINLHGTGTPDNDSSEAKAVCSLFQEQESIPPVSSTKGIFGHSLAASGAMEAAVAIAAMERGIVPPNTGCTEPDPELGIEPVLTPTKSKINTVLSNSFGFGGNNAALILGVATKSARFKNNAPEQERWLGVQACQCVTGAGFLEQCTDRIAMGESCSGILPLEHLTEGLAPRSIRRIKRLSKMALALGERLVREKDRHEIQQVHFGTSWGPMSETHDFLTRLFASEEKLSSPSDFVGSVHNAPAGQLAIKYKAEGPSATATDRHLAFEQALYMAQLLTDFENSSLCIAADEYHDVLSPVFSPSTNHGPSDGGAGFLLGKADSGFARIRTLHLGRSDSVQSLALRINQALGARISAQDYGLVMLRIQDKLSGHADELKTLVRGMFKQVPIVEYEKMLGSFETASACAVALAAKWVQNHVASLGANIHELKLEDLGIVVLNLGEYSATVEVMP